MNDFRHPARNIVLTLAVLAAAAAVAEGGEEMIPAGEPFIDFELEAHDGSTVSRTNLEGRPFLLFFYPKADTAGCTKQACAIRDVYPSIEGEDAVVIGISPDKPPALVKFRQKYDLPFILLSDPDHQVAEAYGAWGEKKSYGKTYMGIIRSHFVINEEGRILDARIKVSPSKSVELAVKAVASADG